MVNEDQSSDEAALEIRQWAESHSAPDEELFVCSNGISLTPRKIAAEVEKRTQLGEEFRQAMAELMKLDKDKKS